jgi:hypothetical protein
LDDVGDQHRSHRLIPQAQDRLRLPQPLQPFGQEVPFRRIVPDHFVESQDDRAGGVPEQPLLDFHLLATVFANRLARIGLAVSADDPIEDVAAGEIDVADGIRCQVRDQPLGSLDMDRSDRFTLVDEGIGAAESGGMNHPARLRPLGEERGRESLREPVAGLIEHDVFRAARLVARPQHLVPGLLELPVQMAANEPRRSDDQESHVRPADYSK